MCLCSYNMVIFYLYDGDIIKGLSNCKSFTVDFRYGAP